MNIRTLAFAALVLVLPLAACDGGGPSGPGEYTVVVESSAAPVAGAVIQFSGTGITGATSQGVTRVWSAALSGGEGVRVVAVNPVEDQPLEFILRVADLSAPAPEATVLVGTDNGNRNVTAVNTYRVTISR